MESEFSSSSFRWLCRETCRCIVAMSVTYFILKKKKKRSEADKKITQQKYKRKKERSVYTKFPCIYISDRTQSAMIGKPLKYYIWPVRVKGKVETCGLNRHNLNLFLDVGHQHSSAQGVKHCSWYSQVTYLWYPLFPNNTSFSWGNIVPISVSRCSSTFCTSMAPSLKSPCAELVCFQSNNISRRANLLSNWFLFYISSKTRKAIFMRICWCFFF